MVSRAQFVAALAAPIVAQATRTLARPCDAPHCNPDLPIAARVDDLIGRMTLAEKVSQFTDNSTAIPRLGIPAYEWWSEALHGVARAGIATVFPQAIGMAATWDAPLLRRIGDVVSTEARAKYNDAVAHGERGTDHGLTFWSPNINIFRDPRWGRGQETYGEDPFLTATMGSSYVRGLQGDDPRYLKVAACAKHFAVHSGPEPLRDHFNVDLDAQTLNDFYLVAFRALVREAGVAGVMSAYSSLDGTPCSANTMLLRDKLRTAWGFAGYVTSDCGAVDDLVETYRIAPDYAHAAAMALKAGVDVSCGGAFSSLDKSVAAGLVAQSELDAALRHLFAIRFRLGMFDPPRVAYSRITLAQNDTPAHAALALRSARESIVLLKNSGLLPLRKTIRSIAIIGPNADSLDSLLGNYNGTPSAPVTVLAGIRAKIGATATVRYVRGCDYVGAGEDGEANAAAAIARESDVAVFVGGISPRLEGEEMPVKFDGFLGGDRTRIELPAVQTTLLQALHATGTPLVYVQMSGSAVACVWEAQNLPAIVQAWYPGEAGGSAVADVLFGDYNPAGRLPVTFYAATADLPPFEDYSVTNRTYRYFTGTPLYAFGHGLSYTTFAYSRFSVTRHGNSLTAKLDVRNNGTRAGDEVVQLYQRNANAVAPQPLRRLLAFVRLYLAPTKTRSIELSIPLANLALWDNARYDYITAPGTYNVEAGASSSDIRLRTTVTIA